MLGAPKGSIGRGSGSKNISEDGATANDLSDRLGEPGIELGTPWYKASDLSITPRQLTFVVGWGYVFVA